ncbi:MAG TPA: sugar ABC transporter permease [Candidatus Limivivens intestinipullorum]|uniref:Sugar ABC transporter permease n=1 Tax=Candidatus Limivivens intestinipullorum TaxID=2840858 RepID=A0A9D1EVB7_9FIRM|nr:sugar ABC transporter permease [Candidatus Limivivens intestinipullorum]
MLLPSAVLLIIFSYLPMGGLVLAFKRFNYADGIFGSPWVGLSNFEFFFSSGKAWTVTKNTALYNLAFIAINTALEIFFAIVLSEMAGKWLKKITQSIIFLPYFISWVIVGSIAYSLLSYETGTLNGALRSMGIDPINFYGEDGWWPFIIVAFSAWKGVGYGMVVYLASILGVDSSLHEAAAIDGANIFQRIRYITLPGILPTTITLTLLALGKIFRGNLDLFYQLVGQNGALFDKTDVIDTYVFRMTISSTDVGQTVAIGFYQSVLCFITILIANWIVRKKDENYALF